MGESGAEGPEEQTKAPPPGGQVYGILEKIYLFTAKEYIMGFYNSLLQQRA